MVIFNLRINLFVALQSPVNIKHLRAYYLWPFRDLQALQFFLFLTINSLFIVHLAVARSVQEYG